MEIKVQIVAEELAEAINNLATALNTKPEAVESGKETGKRRGRRKKEAEDVAKEEIEVAEAEETAEKEAEVTESEQEADDDDVFEEEEKPLSRAEIQARLKEIAGAGKAKGLKKLVLAYGVNKLSEVPNDKLPELLKKAEAL